MHSSLSSGSICSIDSVGGGSTNSEPRQNSGGVLIVRRVLGAVGVLVMFAAGVSLVHDHSAVTSVMGGATHDLSPIAAEADGYGSSFSKKVTAKQVRV